MSFLCLQSCLKLSRIFSLFDDGNFVAMFYHLFKILVKNLFWESDVKFFGSTHPVQVKKSLTYDRITEENLVKLAEFEKEYFFEVVLLHLPILIHSRCKVLPLLGRNVERSVVISLLTKFNFVFVSNVVRL